MWNAIRKTLEKHKNNVEFNQFEHTYTLKRTGKELTSVSKALAFFDKTYDEVDPSIMERAKLRGTLIHTIAEWLFSQFPSIKTEEQLYEYANTIEIFDSLEHGYLLDNLFAQYKQILKDEPDLIITEQLLYDSASAIAGTCDLIVFKHIGPVIFVNVIDWKTGELKVQNAAQVALYQVMLRNALNKLSFEDVNEFIFDSKCISLKNNNDSNKC